MIQNILSVAGTKARVYEAGFQDKCTLAFSGLVIDELQHVVLRESRRVELTSTEFEILGLLARHSGVVFGREKIYSAVWKEFGAGDCQVVMNHICNSREKINSYLIRPVYIQTVWGVGYRFCGELPCNKLVKAISQSIKNIFKVIGKFSPTAHNA